MTATLTSPAPVGCSPEEWSARVELAGTFRLFAMLGWDEMIFNHISFRLPGETPTYLMNPFGLMYEEITASQLIKVDLDGNLVEDSPYAANPAGFLFHGAIHRTVPHAHCVMHTHTTAGSAVACLDEGLSPDNFYAAQLRNSVGYHEFEGITVNEGEIPRMLASLNDKPLLILRNHGLLSHGPSIAHAFYRLWVLDRACQVQLAAQSTGQPLRSVTDAAARSSAQVAADFVAPGRGPERLMFEALLRKVHRHDPGFAS
ncbi:class II aldolase/adducin family protein [Rhodococcus sp. LB1]|uniref:class II aldolase/adducin family protein n=1 Tax=Rhodococcus sp. LB1 TaxID=1807499 RepID=UPI00077A4AA7|nr:class II aldolase/adducin family protein [Rhodococcus sp. LB1]KXX60726.1 class II aldolase [Rhodococcus sp. LB1]